MELSSDGKTWWARCQGRVFLQGQADGAGLYWVTVQRLTTRKMRASVGDLRQPTSEVSGKLSKCVQEHQTPSLSRDSRVFNPKSSRPVKNGWSRKFDQPLESAQQGCGGLDDSELSANGSSDSLSEEHYAYMNSGDSNPSPNIDATLLTRQQSADLMAAHLRWGHRSFRRCAQVLGVPAPEKAPFCEACVEAKASRYPRRSRAHRTAIVREPATRPGYRLFFDPIGPFKEATLHRYKYALVVLDDFSGLLQTKLMIRLSDWFAHLSALVRRIEAEKGSERVVAQLGK